MSDVLNIYASNSFSHLPQDWKLGSLKALVKTDKKITYGIVQPGEYDPEGILLIRGVDYMTGWKKKSTFFKVKKELHKKFKRSAVTPDDILLSIAGYTGEVSQVPKWIYEANITQTTARISCNESLLIPRYLLYFLKSDDGQKQSKRYTKGSAQEGLNLEDVEKFICPLPPLPEQKKIASILTSVDDVIEKTESQISKLQDLKKGMMTELLTKGIGHTEFKDSPVGRIPKSWDVLSCGQVCNDIVVGVVIKPSQYYQETGIPALRSANVREEGLNRNDLKFISEESNEILVKSKLQEGDVVTVRTGYPGTTAVVTKSFVGFNCIDLIISRPSKILNSSYLSLWINSDFGKDQVLKVQGGLAQQHFNVGEMKKMLIAMPPLKEQERIAEFHTGITHKILKTNQKLSQTKALKKALMNDLLSGKRRVIID